MAKETIEGIASDILSGDRTWSIWPVPYKYLACTVTSRESSSKKWSVEMCAPKILNAHLLNQGDAIKAKGKVDKQNVFRATEITLPTGAIIKGGRDSLNRIFHIGKSCWFTVVAVVVISVFAVLIIKIITEVI